MIFVSIKTAMAVRPSLITSVADVTQSLNVAQTLSQARKVLKSHRHWMQTHTATVTPLDAVEEYEGFSKPVRSGWLQAPDNRDVGGTADGEKGSKHEYRDEDNEQLETEKRLGSGSNISLTDEGKRRLKKKKRRRTPHNSVAPSTDESIPDPESRQRTPIPDVFTISSHSVTSQPLVTRVAWTASSYSLASADNTNTTEPVCNTDLSNPNSQRDHVNQEGVSDEEEPKAEGDDDSTALHDLHVSSSISLRNGNELQSSSTGTIIAIAPAPKHRTTSYRRHKHSKVGSEREPVDSSADDSLSDQDSPSVIRSNTIERQHHSYVADPTLVTVLPKKHQTGARAWSMQSMNPKLHKALVKERHKNEKMEQKSEKRANDEFSEGKSMSQIPDIKKQESSVHADVPQSEPLSNLCTISNDDLLVEDAEDESFDIPADSSLSPAATHELIPNKKFVPILDDVVEVEAEDGEVGDSLHSKEYFHQAAKKSSSKFALGSASLEKPQVKHKRRKLFTPKRTPVEHLANDIPTVSHISQKDYNEDMSQEDSEGSVSNYITEVKVISPAQTENSSTDEEVKNADQLPPLLKVKSSSSLNLPTDFKFTRKRDRNPPPYSLHCSSHAVSIPSCPVYATIQPSEAELVKAYSKAVSCVSPPTSSPSSKHTELVDEGIQTNLMTDQDKNSTYIDNEFIQQIQSPQLSVSVPDSSLEPGELHFAARNGNLAKIRDLLVKGYDVNGLDGGGYTPLMYCILPEGQGVQLHCADLLIRRGANLDHKAVDGSTALHLASYVGALSLIQLLLFNGANPDVRDCDGRLPLHWATKPLTTKPITELLKYSASEVNSPDSADMTTLMWAAYHQNFQVLQYLLSSGADVEEKDMDGETAMHWSVHEKETRCLELLLKPDMTYFKDHNGRTVMHKAAKLGCVAAVEIITALRHDTVHDIDKKGRTPLHYSAVNDKVDVCYTLLTKGADATQKDFEGKTPLDYAREQGNEYAVALFTCQENSIADFTRMTRTMIHSTTIAHPTDNLTNAESNSVITETLSMDQTSLLDNASIMESQEPLTQADIEVLSHGSYLGYFPRNNNDPPRHYYFWVSPNRGTLCWSRSDSRRNKKEARVFRVYSSPSLAVTARPDYSPHELHRYAFWLTTDKGVLDLLAYTEEAYKHWIKEFQVLAQQKSEETEHVSGVGVNSEYEREEIDEQTDPVLPQNEDLPSEASSVLGLTFPVTSTPAHNQTNHKMEPPLDPYQVM